MIGKYRIAQTNISTLITGPDPEGEINVQTVSSGQNFKETGGRIVPERLQWKFGIIIGTQPPSGCEIRIQGPLMQCQRQTQLSWMALFRSRHYKKKINNFWQRSS